MAIDLSLLRVFVAVANAGSLTRAAATLRMQQPTVSRAVLALERDLGVPLFERRSRGVVLTPQGEAVLDASAPLLEALEQGIAGALAAPEAPGILAVGAAEVLAATIVPKVVVALAKKKPSVVPYVLVAPADVLAERVRQGALAFALVMHVKRGPGLGVRALPPLRHQLVVARGLERDRRVLARFIGSREVEDPGNRQFPTLARLRTLVPEAHIAASSNSLTTHKALVLAGHGVAVLPELLVRAELDAGQLVPVLPEVGPFPPLLVSRTGTVWSEPARAFLTEVEHALAEG